MAGWLAGEGAAAHQCAVAGGGGRCPVGSWLGAGGPALQGSNTPCPQCDRTLAYIVIGKKTVRGQKVTAPTSPTMALKKGCSKRAARMHAVLSNGCVCEQGHGGQLSARPLPTRPALQPGLLPPHNAHPSPAQPSPALHPTPQLTMTQATMVHRST